MQRGQSQPQDLLTVSTAITWLAACREVPGQALGLAAVTALVLLRDEGRGQRVNLVELRAGQGA